MVKMSKVKDILGKDSGITLSNIEDAINSDLLHENDEIELTDADRFITEPTLRISQQKRKENQTQKIVSELTSFLNSGRGMGLLFLGLEERNNKIIKKCVKTFKNKEQIRSLVVNQIGVIPTNTRPFKLNIIPVSCDDGENIFLVEVQSNDLNCIYYSKVDNNVYIRQGDEAKSLSIPDFLELLAQKNYARIFLELVQKTEQDSDSYLFNINLHNEGIEPGRYVNTVLHFLTFNGTPPSISGFRREEDEINIDLSDSNIIKDVNFKYNGALEHFEHLLKPGNKLSISFYTAMAGYPPNTKLIYPNSGGKLGDLTIPKDDIDIHISVHIQEDRGQTQQVIYIKSDKNKITVKEISKSFKPYLNL